MKKTPLRAKNYWNKKPVSKKIKKTQRAKKIELRKQIIAQYELTNIRCSRWGTAKKPTRTDILKGMLWTVFSQYIRQRDEGICISCGERKTYSELQAGHFAPAGGNDLELCFSEFNVNGECAQCNADFKGNGWHLILMRVNMITKYGIDVLLEIERLQGMKRSFKWDEIEYVQRIKYYSEKLKEMKV